MTVMKTSTQAVSALISLLLISGLYTSISAVAAAPQNKSQYAEALYQACTIYCWGDILNTIQLSGIYNDSKTFVDMPLKYDPDVVMDAFNNITNKSDINSLTTFMDDYFYPVGSDLDDWIPTDLQDNPPFLATITNPEYAAWAYDINQLWGTLGKQVNASVLENPQRHSFVPLNYPMIVPGGRFRESYYWDSWWILKGLLVSNMPDSAMNVINILLEDILNFGFVPNGARIYYLDRSQPPVLSEMILDMCTFYGKCAMLCYAMLWTVCFRMCTVLVSAHFMDCSEPELSLHQIICMQHHTTSMHITCMSHVRHMMILLQAGHQETLPSCCSLLIAR